MTDTVEACHMLGLPARRAIDMYPNSAVVPIRFDSPRLQPLAEIGYRLIPSGPRTTLVREDAPWRGRR